MVKHVPPVRTLSPNLNSAIVTDSPLTRVTLAEEGKQPEPPPPSEGAAVVVVVVVVGGSVGIASRQVQQYQIVIVLLCYKEVRDVFIGCSMLYISLHYMHK